MKLAVFHYHLRPGGVTGVITQGCIALGTSDASPVDEVVLVTGSRENTESVSSRIAASAPELGVSVRVHPELRYVSDQDGVASEELERRIAALLEEEHLSADVVWWVHNYHLGKNPPFSAALLSLLEKHPEQRAILEIHDFPECARFENLVALRAQITDCVYPLLPNVTYATINYRDHALLVEAGLPAEAVVALPNPVPPPPGARAERAHQEPSGAEAVAAEPRASELGARLAEAFGGRFPSFDSGGRVFLYPVRAIRRKNVLEAGFLTKLYNGAAAVPANLIVTLPGVSPLEKPYSELVRAAFEAGTVPGMMGIGAELEEAGLDFEGLIAASDLIISTSVQEGFGFAFFEAPIRGMPLCARYLDVLDGFEGLFEGTGHLFYRELRVPFESPSIDSIRSLLRIRYEEHLERSAAEMPRAARERVEAEIESMLSEHTIDFSFLMPQMQYAYLKDVDDEVFANEVRSINLEVVGTLVRTVEAEERSGNEGGTRDAARTESAASRITAELGYDRYAERLSRAIDGLPRPTSGGAGAPIQRHLIEAFAHKDYFRLLYGPVGE